MSESESSEREKVIVTCEHVVQPLVVENSRGTCQGTFYELIMTWQLRLPPLIHHQLITLKACHSTFLLLIRLIHSSLLFALIQLCSAKTFIHNDTFGKMIIFSIFFVIAQALEAYDYGSMPRQIECYSCMSLAYQNSWKYLQATYIYPKVFTDRCKDPGIERGMPTVGCSTVCISMFEPDVEAGVLIGYKYIRGCLDRVLRNGFNQTALRTHRFHQNNHCRTLSRANLFNPARATDPPALGDVQLCSCYGDRCNGSNSGSFIMILLPVLILMATWRIL